MFSTRLRQRKAGQGRLFGKSTSYGNLIFLESAKSDSADKRGLSTPWRE
jgi:hypothetical protein